MGSSDIYDFVDYTNPKTNEPSNVPSAEDNRALVLGSGSRTHDESEIHQRV